MQLVAKFITFLACLFSNGSVGTAPDGSAVLRGDDAGHSFLHRFELIHSPVQLPPKRETAVVYQEETGIDEEDSDKIGNVLTLSQRHHAFNSVGRSSGISRFLLVGTSIATGPVAAVLRC